MVRALSEAFSGALSGAFSRAYSKSAAVVPLPDRSRPELEEGIPHRCLFRARELSESTILVAVIGEIDDANSDDLISYVQGIFGKYRQLVLDLSRVDYFDEAAFSSVHTLNTHCAGRKISWVLVPSPDVQRTLQIHDPDGILPTAGNIVSAVASLTRAGRGRLRLA